MTIHQLTKVVLDIGPDRRSRFRDQVMELGDGDPRLQLSRLLPADGLQFRHSPPGYRSGFHCAPHSQWCFVLQGQLEIGLQDGSARVFGPGDHLYSCDILPDGIEFDPSVHGHCSRLIGDAPLVTAFIRG